MSDLGFKQAAVGRVGRAASLSLLALRLDFWRKNKRVTDERSRRQQMALRPGTSVSSPSRCSVVTSPRATMKAIFCGEKRREREGRGLSTRLLGPRFRAEGALLKFNKSNVSPDWLLAGHLISQQWDVSPRGPRLSSGSGMSAPEGPPETGRWSGPPGSPLCCWEPEAG